MNFPLSNPEGFARALDDPKYIYLVKKTTFVNSNRGCELTQSPRAIYTLNKGFIFQKGSPYR